MTETLNGTGVVLTDAAATKVAELLVGEDPGLALRIAATPAGCSGLRYELFFDDQSYTGDVVTMFGEVSVVVDQVSAGYLAGAVIDFADRPTQSGFTIDNPYATDSCGCGDSDQSSGCGCGGGGHSCGCGGGGCC
jgi:iron-sulfur cluster assembly accessory protein